MAVECLPCKVHEKTHLLFSEEVVKSFDALVFDFELNFLDDDVLKKVEDFVSVYDEKDLTNYFRKLDFTGLADFEKHPCDWYRCENCELCVRTTFFLNVAFALLYAAFDKAVIEKLPEKKRKRIEKILLGLLNFVPRNSPWAEAVCNFLMPEANRFVDDPEREVEDLDAARERLRVWLVLFPSFVEKAIERVNGAGIYLQYLDERFRDLVTDERVLGVIDEIVERLEDRYDEEPIDPYLDPEVEENPFVTYGFKSDERLYERLEKLRPEVQKMIYLHYFTDSNFTFRIFPKREDPLECGLRSWKEHMRSFNESVKKYARNFSEKDGRGQFYEYNFKKWLYKKVTKEDKDKRPAELYRKWEKIEEKGGTTLEKFQVAYDFFYYFRSLESVYDRVNSSFICFFCRDAGRDVGIDESLVKELMELYDKDESLGTLRVQKKVAIPERYKRYYGKVDDYFYRYLRLYGDYDVPTLSYETRSLVLRFFEKILKSYVDRLVNEESHLIKNWNEFGEKVAKLERDLKRAKKEAWLFAKYEFFLSKLGFLFGFCFPGEKRRYGYRNFSRENGSCGLEYVSTCLSEFGINFMKRLDEVEAIKEVSDEEVCISPLEGEEKKKFEIWKNAYQFWIHLTNEERLAPWYGVLNVKDAIDSNLLGLYPFLTEGISSQKKLGMDLSEIAQYLREILELKNPENEELLKKMRCRALEALGVGEESYEEIFREEEEYEEEYEEDYEESYEEEEEEYEEEHEEEELGLDFEERKEEVTEKRELVESSNVSNSSPIDFVLREEEDVTSYEKKSKKAGFLNKVSEALENVFNLGKILGKNKGGKNRGD